MEPTANYRSETPRRRAGLSSGLLLLAATVISGGAGYAVTWIVGLSVSTSAYTGFAVFWSTLYILVGTVGGLQQEITRGTVIVDTEAAASVSASTTSRIVPFALAAATVAALAAALAGLAGGELVFGSHTELVPPLAVGVGAYTLVAALSGALYGVKGWSMLAFLIAADGVVRLALILIGLAMVPTTNALAWAVVLPFPIVLLVALPFAARVLGGTARLDSRYRVIVRNSLLTITGAAATALVVSGFPFLLRTTSPGVQPELLAPVILGLTLVRAPLVVPFFALQSFMIVRFRDAAGAATGRLLVTLVWIVAGSAAIAALAAFIGPPLIVLIFGEGYRLEPSLVFVMVLTSGLVGVLAVSGAAVIAYSLHALYAAGWAIAAVVTLGILLVPGDVSTRTILALIAGPLSGLAIHLAGFFARRRAGTAETPG